MLLVFFCFFKGDFFGNVFLFVFIFFSRVLGLFVGVGWYSYVLFFLAYWMFEVVFLYHNLIIQICFSLNGQGAFLGVQAVFFQIIRYFTFKPCFIGKKDSQEKKNQIQFSCKKLSVFFSVFQWFSRSLFPVLFCWLRLFAPASRPQGTHPELAEVLPATWFLRSSFCLFCFVWGVVWYIFFPACFFV